MDSLKQLASAVLAAFIWWAIMFSPLTAPHINFWWMMTGAALLLICLASRGSPPWWHRLSLRPENIIWGLMLAAGLWLIFLVGNEVAVHLFSFAHTQVSSIYRIREGLPPWALTLLLALVIGPAEEIFWRGYVQEQCSRRWGANVGFVVATALYAAVHVPSCNFMLVMASLVAGAVWGICCRLFRDRFTAIVISHSLWDVAVFVWFPIL